MDDKQGAANCRWAKATLFLPPPFWLEAWDCPWTCTRDAIPRVLETTQPCAGCPRWEPRLNEERQPPVHEIHDGVPGVKTDVD